MSGEKQPGSSTSEQNDNAALWEAYAQEATAEREAASTSPERTTTTPETTKDSEVKALQLQIKEMQAQLSEALDRLAALQAQPGEKAATPITVEAITSAPAGTAEHSPSESYVRNLMPNEGEGIADYITVHNEKMGALTKRGQEAIEQRWQAEDRRELRRSVRRDERAARRAERQDRRHELRDKAATKLRSWGRAALRGVGRGLRATGRAIKGAATGARQAVKNG